MKAYYLNTLAYQSYMHVTKHKNGPELHKATCLKVESQRAAKVLGDFTI